MHRWLAWLPTYSSILMLTLAVPALAGPAVPPEVGAISKLLNPGGYFEIQPGAGVRYDAVSFSAAPTWYVGAKVLAGPRKWLGVQGQLTYDVPGTNRPRMEASTWVRF